MGGNIFLELTSFPNVGEQVASAAYFHNKDNMLLCFEWLVKPHDVLLLRSSQNIELLHHFTFWRFFGHELFVYRFKSYEFAWKSVDRQIDFTESAFTHHLSNLVVFN